MGIHAVGVNTGKIDVAPLPIHINQIFPRRLAEEQSCLPWRKHHRYWIPMILTLVAYHLKLPLCQVNTECQQSVCHAGSTRWAPMVSFQWCDCGNKHRLEINVAVALSQSDYTCRWIRGRLYWIAINSWSDSQHRWLPDCPRLASVVVNIATWANPALANAMRQKKYCRWKSPSGHCWPANDHHNKNRYFCG